MLSFHFRCRSLRGSRAQYPSAIFHSYKKGKDVRILANNANNSMGTLRRLGNCNGWT